MQTTPIEQAYEQATQHDKLVIGFTGVNRALIDHYHKHFLALVQALEEAVLNLKDSNSYGIAQPSLPRLQATLAAAKNVQV